MTLWQRLWKIRYHLVCPLQLKVVHIRLCVNPNLFSTFHLFFRFVDFFIFIFSPLANQIIKIFHNFILPIYLSIVCYLCVIKIISKNLIFQVRIFFLKSRFSGANEGRNSGSRQRFGSVHGSSYTQLIKHAIWNKTWILKIWWKFLTIIAVSNLLRFSGLDLAASKNPKNPPEVSNVSVTTATLLTW